MDRLQNRSCRDFHSISYNGRSKQERRKNIYTYCAACSHTVWSNVGFGCLEATVITVSDHQCQEHLLLAPEHCEKMCLSLSSKPLQNTTVVFCRPKNISICVMQQYINNGRGIIIHIQTHNVYLHYSFGSHKLQCDNSCNMPHRHLCLYAILKYIYTVCIYFPSI